MVVDDDKDILTIITKGLENIGFEVPDFNDPLLAMRHIENGCKERELLVSDVRMPKHARVPACQKDKGNSPGH